MSRLSQFYLQKYTCDTYNDWILREDRNAESEKFVYIITCIIIYFTRAHVLIGTYAVSTQINKNCIELNWIELNYYYVIIKQGTVSKEIVPKTYF
jgi:hypothetical protein